MMPLYFLSIKNIFKTVVLVSCIILLSGCQKKEEKPVQQTPAVTDTMKNQTVAADTSTKPVDDIKDIMGKYTGTFDTRGTVLNITEQEGNKFKGSITINYREANHQKVSGEFDPKTLSFSMADQVHSRNQGKYYGKFSVDWGKMSGTFTKNLDGLKCSFNLNKKL